MAELGIPLLALGSLYVACKQKKKENFTGSKLPNIDTKDKNYSVDLNGAENELTSQLSTTNKYDGQTAYTDKYFNQQFNDGLRESYSFMDTTKIGDNKFTSLTQLYLQIHNF